MTTALVLAIPKGRVQRKLAPVLTGLGFEEESFNHEEDRRLLWKNTDGSVELLLLKPDDVPTYVEYGAAHLGICGRDVLNERGYDLYEPLDLAIGKCRLVVAAPVGNDNIPEIPRVATKFVRSASAYFESKGRQAEIIQVSGSVELAPLVKLADLIVDLVETGSTLAQNHLEIREVIAEISSVVVVNHSAFKLRRSEIATLLERIRVFNARLRWAHVTFRASRTGSNRAKEVYAPKRRVDFATASA